MPPTERTSKNHPSFGLERPAPLFKDYERAEPEAVEPSPEALSFRDYVNKSRGGVVAEVPESHAEIQEVQSSVLAASEADEFPPDDIPDV